MIINNIYGWWLRNHNTINKLFGLASLREVECENYLSK